MRYIVRKLALIAAVAGVALTALVVVGSSAAAAGTPPQTITQSFHFTQSVTVLNQCTNTLVDLSEMTNEVFHVTFFPDTGDVHVTSTEEDSFTGVDETSSVTYRGHALFWDNFNGNTKNANFTFTNAIHATGSDGSMILIHEVGHGTLRPDGTIAVFFDKPSLTCS
jgi:hypothetical protein